jgi:hypothetical protein
MVATTRSAKRPASEALKHEKNDVKKQRVDHNSEDISTNDGIYTASPETLPATPALPIRSKLKKGNNADEDVSDTPLPIDERASLAKELPGRNKEVVIPKPIPPTYPLLFPDFSPKFDVATPAQVYAPEYQTGEMLALWQDTWNWFKGFTPTADEATKSVSPEMWSGFSTIHQVGFPRTPILPNTTRPPPYLESLRNALLRHRPTRISPKPRSLPPSGAGLHRETTTLRSRASTEKRWMRMNLVT